MVPADADAVHASFDDPEHAAATASAFATCIRAGIPGVTATDVYIPAIRRVADARVEAAYEIRVADVAVASTAHFWLGTAAQSSDACEELAAALAAELQALSGLEQLAVRNATLSSPKFAAVLPPVAVPVEVDAGVTAVPQSRALPLAAAVATILFAA